jgi:ABC-type Fe3+ transport system permease subunit
MRRAYLLIAVPGFAVSVGYVLVFRSLGLKIQAAPFVAAVGAAVAALWLVRRCLQRKPRRAGRSSS